MTLLRPNDYILRGIKKLIKKKKKSNTVNSHIHFSRAIRIYILSLAAEIVKVSSFNRMAVLIAKISASQHQTGRQRGVVLKSGDL